MSMRNFILQNKNNWNKSFWENLGVRTVDEVVKVRKWNDLGSKQITTQTADFGKIRLQDLYFACSFHVGIDPKVVGSNLGDVFFLCI